MAEYLKSEGLEKIIITSFALNDGFKYNQAFYEHFMLFPKRVVLNFLIFFNFNVIFVKV